MIRKIIIEGIAGGQIPKMSEEMNRTETIDKELITSEPMVTTGVHPTIDSEAAEEILIMTVHIEISIDETKTIGAHKGVEVPRVNDPEAGKEEEKHPPKTSIEMTKIDQ